METFSIENPISVDFRLRDPSGVTTVTAFFVRKGRCKKSSCEETATTEPM